MIDLVGKRWIFFIISITIIVAGVIGFFVNGVTLDIQFQGGTILEIPMKDGNFEPSNAEKIVNNTTGKLATAQKSETFDSTGESDKIYLLTINIASKQGSLTGEEQNRLIDALRTEFNIDTSSQMSVSNVEPFIGKELLSRGLWAVFWASILIILYITVRFRVMSGFSAGVIAILTLFHDIAVMLSIYILFKVPINDAFIAAVLTVMGYSMNDTVIIYDRIRENSHLLKKVPVAQLVNRSIIQTLTRSINTVLTVIICLVTVYIFASVYNIGSIKNFTLPLIVGITCGAYSSILIASPLWAVWMQRKGRKQIPSKPRKGSAPRYDAKLEGKTEAAVQAITPAANDIVAGAEQDGKPEVLPGKSPDSTPASKPSSRRRQKHGKRPKRKPKR